MAQALDDDNEEENAVRLSSPDPTNRLSVSNFLHNTEKTSLEKKNVTTLEEQKIDTLDIKQASNKEQTSGSSEEDKRTTSKNTNAGTSLHKKTQSHIPEGLADQSRKDKAAESTSTSPKRRKVLKTPIDERGREVTEVVWEGEAAGTVGADINMPISDAGIGNRVPVTTKTPVTNPANSASTNPTSKAANSRPAKGGAKNPKQGNILSFFKKV